MRFSSMNAGMLSRILWISPSTFATYSRACEACCSIPLNFSFCSSLVMMRHAARRQPAVLPYATDRKFRSSTESSKGCSPTLCRESVISMTAMERRCSATLLAGLWKPHLSHESLHSHDYDWFFWKVLEPMSCVTDKNGYGTWSKTTKRDIWSVHVDKTKKTN